MTSKKSKPLPFVLVGSVLASLTLVMAAQGLRTSAGQEPESSAEAQSDPTSYAQYLANAGVLVVHEDNKIAFDPIFRSSFGTYLLLSEELERNLFAGEPPFDGLDAVFISHYHGDHFSPKDILRLLAAHQQLEVYAPEQAVAALERLNGVSDDPLENKAFERVHKIALQYEQAPIAIEADGFLVEAVRIPHSGWPDRMQDVENIAFRVSLRGGGDDDPVLTTAHLGDADVRDEHFDHDAEYWRKRPLDVAFPPYWYLQTEDGRAILSNRLNPTVTIGVHVPKNFEPSDKTAITNEQDGVMVFTEPQERRSIAP